MANTLFLTLFLALVCLSAACSCPPRTFKDSFCSADSSVRVKIVKEIAPRRHAPPLRRFYFVYKASVKRRYKGSEPMANRIFIRTPKESSLCALSLQVGEQYLINLPMADKDTRIFGKKSYGINGCSTAMVFKHLSNEVKWRIKRSRKGDDVC